MKNFCKRILSVTLIAIMLLGVFPINTTKVSAATWFYQTAKADVPIWSAASSKSTKKGTISTKGTVLRVTNSTYNSSGNLWYKLSNGCWVFSGNVTGHSHKYNGGICTGIQCGYEWPYSIHSLSGTYVVTNPSGAKIWSRPYSNNSVLAFIQNYTTDMTITAYTKNADGNIWYLRTDGRWVFSGNVTQRFSVWYNANGGNGAPSQQYVLAGNSLTISSTRPTRSGYVFLGWSTNPGAASASYAPGYSYRFSANTTLYAVWKKCSHSYDGGICTTCGYEYPLSISSHSGTFVVTNKNGAKIRTRPYSSRSTNVRLAPYNSVLSVISKTKNASNNLWYKLSDGNWVFSDNVTQQHTVSYNANGGNGAPSSQTVLTGKKLTTSTKTPTRIGYVFKGWATSSGSSTVSYKAGTAYTFTSSKSLYAVWEKCSHSYKGGVCGTCGHEYGLSITAHSGTYVVTNKDGAKIRSRPYSSNSTTIRRAVYNSVLTITHKTTNQEGNVWYKLSDGSWVFSGNVTRRYTVSYKANGGESAPSAQTVLAGKSLTLSSKKPTRIGYTFQGWATSSGSSTVTYKAGKAYTINANKTVYAVWKKCSHTYKGGICTKCNYEYANKVTAHAATYVVTKTDGAKVWSRPYSSNSTNIRRAAYNSVLTITHKATNQEGNVWYKLSDGNWVFSGNVTRRYTVSYKANGGKSAPSSQTVLTGKKLTLTTKQPTRTGYLFQGWATSASATKVTYGAGKRYSFTANKTLYAVWSKCSSHAYSSNGYCAKCKLERPYDVVTYSAQKQFKITTATATAYTRPFTGATKGITVVKGDRVPAKAYAKVGSSTWYKLANNQWIQGSKVSAASDSDIKKVTTVAAISQKTTSAVAYLEKNVGAIKKSGRIPGLIKTVTRTKDGASVTTCANMVPQGLTFAGDYLMISAYCHCDSKHRSVIYVLDSATRTYKTTLILDDYCHVGGLAKQGNYVWVCDSGGNSTHKKHLRAYSYAEIQQAVAASMPYRTLSTQGEPQKVDTTPSYMCSANGYLYVGKHYEDGKNDADSSDKTYAVQIYYYSVSGTTLKLAGSFTIKGVKQMQGISIRDNSMVVTASLGRYNGSNSKLYVYNFKSGQKTYSKPTKTLNFANMAEGCYIGASYTYVVCESGAKEYRGSPLTRPLDKYVGFSNKALGIS